MKTNNDIAEYHLRSRQEDRNLRLRLLEILWERRLITSTVDISAAEIVRIIEDALDKRSEGIQQKDGSKQ